MATNIKESVKTLVGLQNAVYDAAADVADAQTPAATRTAKEQYVAAYARLVAARKQLGRGRELLDSAEESMWREDLGSRMARFNRVAPKLPWVPQLENEAGTTFFVPTMLDAGYSPILYQEIGAMLQQGYEMSEIPMEDLTVMMGIGDEVQLRREWRPEESTRILYCPSEELTQLARNVPWMKWAVQSCEIAEGMSFHMAVLFMLGVPVAYERVVITENIAQIFAPYVYNGDRRPSGYTVDCTMQMTREILQLLREAGDVDIAVYYKQKDLPAVEDGLLRLGFVDEGSMLSIKLSAAAVLPELEDLAQLEEREAEETMDRAGPVEFEDDSGLLEEIRNSGLMSPDGRWMVEGAPIASASNSYLFIGRDAESGETVAIKIFSDANAKSREMEAARALSCDTFECMQDSFDFVVDGLRLGAVVYDLAQTNLGEFLTTRSLAAEERKTFVQNLYANLLRLEQLGIGHGNLTLDNILVYQRPDGFKVVFGDLGSVCTALEGKQVRGLRKCTDPVHLLTDMAAVAGAALRVLSAPGEPLTQEQNALVDTLITAAEWNGRNSDDVVAATDNAMIFLLGESMPEAVANAV